MTIYLNVDRIRGCLLWILIVFWTPSGTAIYRCDFEAAGCQCPWLTSENGGFALSTTGVYNSPATDASGNKSGMEFLRQWEGWGWVFLVPLDAVVAQ